MSTADTNQGPPTSMPPPPVAPAEPRRPKDQMGILLVEVASTKNEQLLFGPTQQRLRGRWDWVNLPRGTTSERGLSKMPTIPGMHIRVDPERRTASIYDPLELPEQRPLLDMIRREHKFLFGVETTSVPHVELRDLKDSEIVTWLYWIRRAYEIGRLRIISGHIPTIHEMARRFPDGVIRRSFFDSLAYGKQAQEKVDEMARQEAAQALEPNYMLPEGLRNL